MDQRFFVYVVVHGVVHTKTVPIYRKDVKKLVENVHRTLYIKKSAIYSAKTNLKLT